MDNRTEFEYLKNNLETFMGYMKEKYPLFHNSNVFLRDLEYGVKHFFEIKNKKLSFGNTENITKELITFLEGKEILKKVANNTWKLNYSQPESVSNEQKPETPAE